MPIRAASLAASLFLGLSLLLFALPLAPLMPEAGLDPSFAFALNMAVVQGLRFGQQIIFTLGPYASTYTALYHPDTDHLMLLGGALIGLGYLGCVLLLGRRRHWLLLLGMALGLAALLSSRDAFLLGYPLALCFALTRLPRNDGQQLCPAWLQASIPALLAAPLGLLAITKGSFAVLGAALLLLAGLYLVLKGRRRQALLMVLAPLASLALLWRHAGQRLADLPAYFMTQIPIISGFTEAMSWPGSLTELLLWGATATAMLAGLALCRDARLDKGLVLLALGLFTLIAFKAGFVRHDMHVVIASDALLLAAALLLLWRPSRGICLSLLLLPVCWFVLDRQHPHSVTHPHLASLHGLYSGAAQALWQRTTEPERLQRHYRNALSALHTRYNFPPLAGSVDIYSVNQAELFASGNHWNPRPIFQSYSAYTAQLARRNAAHQHSEHAADTLLFRLEPIDARLPALEDGAAWLPLLAGYQPSRSLEQGYLQLDRRPQALALAQRPLQRVRARLGESVAVPQDDDLVWARIALAPSAAGRLIGLLYKTSPLTLELDLSDGQTRSFRFIAGMAQTPFLLSPAVLDTADFARLYSAGSQPPRVLRVRILAQHSPAHWQPDFELWFSSLARPPASAPLAARPSPAIALTAAQLASLERRDCEGQLDSINGQAVGPLLGRADALQLEGWTTVAGRQGLTPQAVFIGLIDAQGGARLYRTLPVARSDVNAHFRQPALGHAGYSARIEPSALAQARRLEVVRLNRGRLEHCLSPSIALQ